MNDELEPSDSSSANLTTFDLPQRNPHLALIEISVLATAFSLTVIGNALILVVLIGGGRKLTRMTFMIVHLSCADLFVGFFNILPQLSWKITGNFRGNDPLCRGVAYLQLVAMFVSSYVIVATAVDRYLAICRPLTSYAWTSEKSRYLVLVAWVLSLLFAGPQLVLFSYKLMDRRYVGMYDCWAEFHPSWTLMVYVTWTALAIYVVPAMILAVAYGRICSTVWESMRRKNTGSAGSVRSSRTSTRSDGQQESLKGSSSGPRSFSAAERAVEGVPLRAASSASAAAQSRSPDLIMQRSHVRIMTRAKIRTVKLTLAVNVSYLFCWAPFFICQVWAAFDQSAPYEGPAITILVLLASLNSCTNPWIYILFVDNIRGTVTRYAVRFCCCGGRTMLTTTTTTTGSILSSNTGTTSGGGRGRGSSRNRSISTSSSSKAQQSHRQTTSVTLRHARRRQSSRSDDC